VLETGVNTIVN